MKTSNTINIVRSLAPCYRAVLITPDQESDLSVVPMQAFYVDRAKAKEWAGKILKDAKKGSIVRIFEQREELIEEMRKEG